MKWESNMIKKNIEIKWHKMKEQTPEDGRRIICICNEDVAYAGKIATGKYGIDSLLTDSCGLNGCNAYDNSCIDYWAYIDEIEFFDDEEKI